MADRTEYVNALKARLEEYVQAIEKDRLTVRALLEQIEEKEERVRYIQKLLESEGLDLSSEGIGIYSEASVSDIAFTVVKGFNKKEPIHYRDLADLIFKHGKNIPGKDPAANLIAHLGRDDRFERTGRGMYALKEWGLTPKTKKLIRRRRK